MLYSLLVAIPMIFFYGFVLPLFFMLRLRRAGPSRLTDPSLMLRWGMLHSGYREEKYWWELVVLMRKYCCIILVTFNTRGEFQLHLALGVLIVALHAHDAQNPFGFRHSHNTNNVLHRYEMASLLILLFMLWCADFFSLDLCEAEPVLCDVMVFIVLGSNFVLISLLLIMFTRAFCARNKFKKRMKKIASKARSFGKSSLGGKKRRKKRKGGATKSKTTGRRKPIAPKRKNWKRKKRVSSRELMMLEMIKQEIKEEEEEEESVVAGENGGRNGESKNTSGLSSDEDAQEKTKEVIDVSSINPMMLELPSYIRGRTNGRTNGKAVGSVSSEIHVNPLSGTSTTPGTNSLRSFPTQSNQKPARKRYLGKHKKHRGLGNLSSFAVKLKRRAAHAKKKNRAATTHTQKDDVVDVAANGVVTDSKIEILTDEVSGRRYSYHKTTGETEWVDKEKEWMQEWLDKEKEGANAVKEVQIMRDGTTGRRYSYDTSTGTTAWVDDEEEQVQIMRDAATGRRYSYDIATGETEWVDQEEEEEEEEEWEEEEEEWEDDDEAEEDEEDEEEHNYTDHIYM